MPIETKDQAKKAIRQMYQEPKYGVENPGDADEYCDELEKFQGKKTLTKKDYARITEMYTAWLAAQKAAAKDDTEDDEADEADKEPPAKKAKMDEDESDVKKLMKLVTKQIADGEDRNRKTDMMVEKFDRQYERTNEALRHQTEHITAVEGKVDRTTEKHEQLVETLSLLAQHMNDEFKSVRSLATTRGQLQISGSSAFDSSSTGGSVFGSSSTGGSVFGSSSTGGSAFGSSSTGGSAFGSSSTGGSALGSSSQNPIRGGGGVAFTGNHASGSGIHRQQCHALLNVLPDELRVHAINSGMTPEVQAEMARVLIEAEKAKRRTAQQRALLTAIDECRQLLPEKKQQKKTLQAPERGGFVQNMTGAVSSLWEGTQKVLKGKKTSDDSFDLTLSDEENDESSSPNFPDHQSAQRSNGCGYYRRPKKN